MTRRITYYVVFVTVISGVLTENEENVRDMFKSNMTRNDFSNLLQSLIKLNENRVRVLQKLYRLEDYGVLSEVLRSGDKKTGNGNNLFLIVMSKNPNDPPRRKVGFQVVDSVTPLDAGNNNIYPKLDFVLDPADYISQNIRKKNLSESIFGNVPRVYGPIKTHRADDKSKKLATTTKMLNYGKPGLRTEVKHDRGKTSLKASEGRKPHKDNSRFEIVSNKGKHPNASEKLLHYDGNSNKYPQTVGYNSQSNEYLEIDFTIKNHNLTTTPIIIKHILSNNHKNHKYPLEGKDEQDEDGYGSPFGKIKNDHNSQYTKMDSDISTKKLHDFNNHHSPKTNKNTPKVQRYKQNDKRSTKPIIKKQILSSKHEHFKYPLEGKDEQDEDDYGSAFNKIQNDHNSRYTQMDADDSIKKLHVNNHHNPKTNKYTPKVKVQRNQQNDKRSTKPIIIKDITASNYENTKYPIEDEHDQDENYYGSSFSNTENDHNSQYANINSDISIKKLYDVNNRHKTKTKKNTPKVINLQSTQSPKLNQYNSNRNKQGIKYSKIKTPIDTTTRTNYDIIKNPNLNNDNTNTINRDLTYTKIKQIDVTKEIDNNNKLIELARENVYGGKPVIPETTKDTQYVSYPSFEDHKDVRNNANKYKLKTTIGTPSENFHGFVHHKHVMDNLDKDNPNTANEHYGDYINAESKKDTDYYGVKMFGNGNTSGETFSIFITNVGNGTAEGVKQPNDPKLILNAFDRPESKPIARKPFIKCLNKKALKLCSKSCISAYKNVCQRLRCTSRSKKALKNECKRSCKKTFSSSSSKYSNENSDESAENSDESDSDDDSS